MKNQALFSSKDKSKKLKCRLLPFLFGALRVKLSMLFLFSAVFFVSEDFLHEFLAYRIFLQNLFNYYRSRYCCVEAVKRFHCQTFEQIIYIFRFFWLIGS